MDNRCEECKLKGLCILPVRHAIAPSAVGHRMPKWAGAHGAGGSKESGSEFHPVLRTLRRGFVYLLLGRAKPEWQCYSVWDDGCLKLDWGPAPSMLTSNDEFSCTQHPGDNRRQHYIVIERPKTCPQAWIAFSEFPWTKSTQDRYAKDATARAARMQSFSPRDMEAQAANTAGGYGTQVTKEALLTVLEYADDFEQAREKFPDYRAYTPTLSRANGTYLRSALTSVYTTDPWYPRTAAVHPPKSPFGIFDSTTPSGLLTASGHLTPPHAQAPGGAAEPARPAESAAEYMRQNSTSGHSFVVALKDALGITASLNLFRNTIAARIKQFGVERQYEIEASQYVRSTRVAIMDSTDESFDELERVKSKSLFWQLYNAERDKHPAAADALVLSKHDQTAARWLQYESRISLKKLEAFDRGFDEFLNSASELIAVRGPAHLRWLDSAELTAALNSFDPDDDVQGIQFTNLVGEITDGITATKEGQAWVDRMMTGKDVPADQNLLVRSLTFNHPEDMRGVHRFLELARKSQQQVSMVALDVGRVQSIVRGIPMFRRGVTVHMGAHVTHNANLNKARPIVPVKTFGLDKAIVFVYDWLLRATGADRRNDFYTSLYVKALLLARLGIDYARIEYHLGKELSQEGSRATAHRNWYRRSIAAMTDELEKENHWKALVKASYVPRMKDAKGQDIEAYTDGNEARIGSVALFFQLLLVVKAKIDLGNDPRSQRKQALLNLAYLGMLSTFFGYTASVLNGLRQKAPRYRAGWRYWKLAGHWSDGLGVAIGAYTSFFYAKFDFEDATARRSLGHYTLANLYDARGAVIGAQVVTNTINLGYFSEPTLSLAMKDALIRKLQVSRFGFASTAEAWATLEKQAAKKGMLAALDRAALVATSLRSGLVFSATIMNMVAFALTVVILVVELASDDALQEWFSASAFGKGKRFDQRDDVAHEDLAKIQTVALHKALNAVGLMADDDSVDWGVVGDAGRSKVKYLGGS